MRTTFHKYKLYYLFPLVLVLALGSCENNFEELNKRKDATDVLGPQFLLNFIWTGPSSDRFTSWRSNLIITSAWCQHFASGFGYDTYSSLNEGYTEAYMNRLMPTYMAEAQDIIDKHEGTMMAGMAMIFKVHFMMRLADIHGEIPYSQAFNPAEFLQPKYDPLPEIYNSFMDDLRTAVALIDAGAGENPKGFDPLYGGNIEKWKKFGNSLLLRVGLRLSEVDPALSRSVVEEAIAAGVMESNDDNAWINYSGSFTDGVNASGIGEVFQDFGVAGHLFRYTDVFVDFISDNNDPREVTLMSTYDLVDDQEVLTNAGPGGQVGLRAGGFGDESENIYDFAQPRRDVMVAYNSPAFIMTFAEVEFNRAEAIHRNWIAGSAKDAYESGVRAAMKMLALYPNAEEISDAEIATYLQQPNIDYDSGDPLTLINTQKWVALLFDGYEAYANYRRLNIPTLVPVDAENIAPESDGTIPKRVRYPQSEVITNSENYLEAVGRQGPDNINTRLWWDVD